MKMSRWLIPFAALAGLVLWFGCSNSVSPNKLPHIDRIFAEPDTVQVHGVTTVAVEAVDPDGDGVTYQWECSFGSFVGSGAAVEWQAPAQDGIYTILCTVTDGRGGADHDTIDVVVLNLTLASYEDVTRYETLPVNPDSWRSQGFMLPKDAVIDSIGVRVDHVTGSPGPLVVEVRDDLDGHPSQVIAGSESMSAAAGWRMVGVSAPEFVHGHVPLHLVARGLDDASAGTCYLAADGDGHYLGGINQSSVDQGATWTDSAPVDFKFRVVGHWQ